MASSFTSRLGATPNESVKAPVVVMATSNLTLSGEQTISGVAVVSGDRVGVAAQTTASQNGIYVVGIGTWSRATDWDSSDDVVNGVIVHDTNAGRLYRASFSGVFTLDSTNVSFHRIFDDTAGNLIDTHVATAGQTVFALANHYEMGINALRVYIQGVLQSPSAFTEDTTTQITFSEGLDAGDIVEVITGSTHVVNVANASAVPYTSAGTGAVTTNVQDKLREFVSVKDFGADNTGENDTATAFTNAQTDSTVVIVPSGTYKLDSSPTGSSLILCFGTVLFTGVGAFSGIVLHIKDISYGVDDSGGVGYKTLRVPN